MTTSTETARRSGAHLRYYAKIEGVKDILWDERELRDASGKRLGADPPGGHNLQDDHIVACWRMDGLTAASDEPDVSGNGLTMSASGSPAPAASLMGGSRSYASTSDRHEVLSDPSLVELQRCTISTWVYWTSSAAVDMTIMRKRYPTDGTPSYYLYGTDANGRRPQISIYDGTSVVSATDSVDASIDTWHHLVATWDTVSSKLLRLYVDGVMVSEVDLSSFGSVAYDGSTLEMGGSYDGSVSYMHGRIDDTAIYRVVKSDEWIRRQASMTSFSRPGLRCLSIPDLEVGFGLDLQSMTSDASALQLRIKNIADPTDRSSPSKYFFSRLLAPGRGNDASVITTSMRRQASGDDYVAANATTIHVQSTTGFASSGVAYVNGKEAFSYTAVSTVAQTGFKTNQTIGRFTGVTKGLYPAFSSANRGHTYPFARHNDQQAGDIGQRDVVTSEPIGLIGREIGLYCVAYDPTTSVIFDESDAQLYWAGVVTEGVEYDPQLDSYSITAESILRRLENKILSNQPKFFIDGINLNGDDGSRSFAIEEWDGSSIVAFGNFTIAAGYYRLGSLANAVAEAIGDPSNWSARSGSHMPIGVSAIVDDGLVRIAIGRASAYRFYVLQRPYYAAAAAANSYCHALNALGFTGEQRIELKSAGGAYHGELIGDRPGYYHYQPLRNECNGGLLRGYYEGNDAPWSDQGDYSSTVAWFVADDALSFGVSDEAEAYAVATIAESPITLDYGRAGVEYTTADQTVDDHQNPSGSDRGVGGYVGSTEFYEPVALRRAYIQNHALGPLLSLMYPMISSGTPGYDGATDVCPWQMSIDIPSAIVDVSSILEQNAIAMLEQKISRRQYYIVDKPTKWIDLWAREAQLFGVALVFDRGKIRCKNIASPSHHLRSVVIDESSRIGDRPLVSTTMGNVVNQWIVRVPKRGTSTIDESMVTLTYNDVVSQRLNGSIRSVTIEHPGIRDVSAPGNGTAIIEPLLSAIFRRRALLFRYAQQSVDVQLHPHYRDTVAIGDIVTYEAVQHPDPFGSGLMTASNVMGLVTNVSIGAQEAPISASIVLFSTENIATLYPPWAGAALVDISAANGGWDSSNYYLTLVSDHFAESGDPHDGESFAVGYDALIVESAPEDPASPLSWGPYATEGYTTATRRLQLPTPTTLAGWDPDREYRVVFADWTSASSAQKLDGSWGASSTTHKLGSSDTAKRWS